MIHRSPTVCHKQALLEITHFHVVLLAACLSGLLVNRIAPPNLLLQHLPLRVITAELAADAQSDQNTEAFPSINQQCSKIFPCRRWAGVYNNDPNKHAKGLKMGGGGGGVVLRQASLSHGLQMSRSGVIHPKARVTVQLQHIYCTSCCINRGVCAVWCDKRSQEIERLALKVKYSRNVFTLGSCVKRIRSQWDNWTTRE